MSAEYQLKLPLIELEQADEEARQVLEKAKAQVGFIPNMYSAMANAPALLDTYLYGYEHFRKNSEFSAVEQEVVFLIISRENGCNYCMAAHSMLADKQSGVPEEVTDAIRNYQPVADKKLAALVRFTGNMVETRGRPSQKNVEDFLLAGYNERHILDIILAQAVKTISNYSNHVFHTPVDEMFSHRAWNDKQASAA
ncbi:MAG: carboxymuconolactone decarboxylase family protein [Gammaproteobacteria bacterium]